MLYTVRRYQMPLLVASTVFLLLSSLDLLFPLHDTTQQGHQHTQTGLSVLWECDILLSKCQITTYGD